MENKESSLSNSSQWEIKEIDNGSFGKILLCTNTVTPQQIVIKECKWTTIKQSTNDEEDKMRARWNLEIETIKRLDHYNVVKAIEIPSSLADLFESDFPILGMEYCSGGNLRNVLNKPQNCCGLNEFTIRSILKDISSAIIYLHSHKIVHRDLKPENIVIQITANGHKIYKLIDLGYCKEWKTDTLLSSFVGTLKYLAPEFFISGKYTYSVDYWSFGILTHEIITGLRPFFHDFSPVKYLNILKSKSSDIICAYEIQESREVILTNEIVFNNHLSSFFKKQIEEWLSLVLEWDQHKRSEKSPLEKLNNEILNKFTLKILVLNTLEVHFYDIESEMNLNDLKVLIYSNTAILPENQMIFICSQGMISSQEAIESNRNLLEVFISLKVIQVLILDKSQPIKDLQHKMKSIIPQKMQNILFCPNHLELVLTYKEQYSLWKDFVWLSREAIENYSDLLQASESFFKYNREIHSSTNSQLIHLMTTNSKLVGNLETITRSLVHNLSNFLMMGTINENIGSNLVTYCYEYMRLCKNRKDIDKKVNDIAKEFEKISKFVEFKPDVFDYDSSEPDTLGKETSLRSLEIVQIYRNIIRNFQLMRKKNTDKDKRVCESESSDAFNNSEMIYNVQILLQSLEKKTQELTDSITNIYNLFLKRLQIIKEIKQLTFEIVEQSEDIKKFSVAINSVLWNLLKNVQVETSVHEELQEEIEGKIVEFLATLSINEEFNEDLILKNQFINELL